MAGGLGAGLTKFWMDSRYPAAKLWMQALVQSIGATLCVYVILVGFSVSQYDNVGLTHYLLLPLFIWVVSILICGFGVLMNARKTETKLEPASPARPPLFARLKPKLRKSEIYALCAEDHYVRVITSGGEDLILMRLSDAIKETVPLIGIPTHRSWWVAEAGVKSVSKKSGKLEIQLKNDLIIPVSRSGMKRVKDAAWV